MKETDFTPMFIEAHKQMLQEDNSLTWSNNMSISALEEIKYLHEKNEKLMNAIKELAITIAILNAGIDKIENYKHKGFNDD